MDNLLSQLVSLQKDTWALISRELSISEVINVMTSDRLKYRVERLRLLYKQDPQVYKVEKLNLPAVTFCGTFDGVRQKDKIKAYNSLIVLDIDKLTDEELKRIKNDLLEDEYAFTFWNSPSNCGVKGLVKIEYKFELTLENLDIAHKSAFAKLREYYLNTYNIELDNSGSDTTRLCFLSFDKELVLKENYQLFQVEESDLTRIKSVKKSERGDKVRSSNQRDILYNPSGKNKNYHRQAIQTLIKFLTRKKVSITSDFESWYRVAYALANTFTFDLSERYYLQLCSLDSERFDKTACLNMLIYCYENNRGSINYNTIEFLAEEKGYKSTLEKERLAMGSKK